MNRHLKGVLIGISAVLVGSVGVVFVRMLKHSNVMTQTLGRTGPMGLVLGTFAAVFWRQHVVSKIRAIGLVSAGGCIFLAAQQFAIEAGFLLTRASNVACIINTSPVFCALMDRFVLGDPVRLHTVLMIVFGLTGVAIIIGGDMFTEASTDTPDMASGGTETVGNLISLINPISWAFYWMIIRRAQKRREHATSAVADCSTVSPAERWWEELLAIQIVTTVLQGVISLAGVAATGWNNEIRTFRRDDLWVYIVSGSVWMPTVVLLFSLAPRYIPTAVMGCIKALEMIMLPFWAWVYNGEVPRAATYIGGSVILLAVGLHSFISLSYERGPPDSYIARTDIQNPQDKTSSCMDSQSTKVSL
eukprot:TRINITY_DN92583_c0_g1_i1.p1 TRINITY_DN92583_c0_g1~~TRINITY_DN92583_c0_g1_i1.p1  ORF type:complete len:360 (+),score=13.87 TRINITY_DN92583_c0_g1_i1:48-1127(+)